MGLLFLWIRYASSLFAKVVPSNKGIMLGVLGFVLVVSVGWEIFEYVFDIADPIGGNYVLDTTYDLIFDFCGAVVAGLIGRTKRLYD